MIHIVIVSRPAHGGDISAVFSSPDAAVAHDYAKQLPAELNDAEAEVLVISCPAPALAAPSSPAAPKWTAAPDHVYQYELDCLLDDECVYLDVVVRRGRLNSNTSTAKDTYDRETAQGGARTMQRFPLRGYAHGAVGYSADPADWGSYPWNCPFDSFFGGYVYSVSLEGAKATIKMLNAINDGNLAVLCDDDGIIEVAIASEVDVD